MPVRYDIAAQVPQAAGGGMDPLNAFATMQAMSYRQQQNALAQMQMQEYQRKLQAEQAVRGLSPNFQDPRFAEQVFRYDPDFARQLYGSQIAGERERRMAEQAAAAADETRRRATLSERKFSEIDLPKAGLERQELEAKMPGIQAEAAGKRAKTVPEAAAAARELLRPIYMARTPEQAAERYADIYPQLKEIDPNIARRLGYQYNPQAVSDFIVGPEEFKESRKQFVVEPGKLVAQPTGRFGEAPIAMEPVYTPNAMAPAAPPVNAMSPQPTMLGDEDLSPQERIIQRTLRKRTLLQQVPPEDRPKVQSQLDLAETVQAANEGVRRLADAGGITAAGQTKVENWKAKSRTTRAGLALGNLSDSQVAEEYNNLRTIAGVMRQRVAGAIGLTARQMDAAKEMEAFEKIVGGDPSAEGLASAVRRLNTINQLLGTGEAERFESPRGKAGEEPKTMGGIVDFGSLK
jgi:hypothetical protein